MLNQTLIDQIDTPDDGNTAPIVTGNGNDGDAATAVAESFAADSFLDPSAALNLTPSVSGGLGGAGVGGLAGTTEPANEIALPPTIEGGLSTIEYQYFAGGAGGPGGHGGAGAAGALSLQSDIIGTAANPYGGTVTLSATVDGGPGGAGADGAQGGSGGFSEVMAFPPEIDLGAAGGVGGSGSGGGRGGDATVTIDGLSEVAATRPTIIDLVTSGGQGGEGGDGAAGGGGGQASAGGSGGTGGAGGVAGTTLSDSTIVAPASVTIDLTALGGWGGRGGAGAAGGFGDQEGSQGFGTSFTSVLTAGLPGAGGDGGATGAANVSFIGNTVTAGSAVFALDADTGSPGKPVSPVPAIPSSQQNETIGHVVSVIETVGEPAGLAGVTGTIAASSVVFSDNTITTATDLTLAISAGNVVFAGNSLTGGAGATLDVSGCGANETVDDAHGLLAIDGSAGNAMAGFASFVLASGAVFIAGAGAAEVVYVAPDPDTIVLTPGHAALTLEGATAANTVLQFQGYGAAGLADIQADTTVHGGNVTIAIAGDGAVTMPVTDWTASASTVTLAPACFVAGTRIGTERGEVAVERLGLGERVETVSGRYRPVRWLGRRVVDCRRHPEPQKVWPVRVAAGAFGDRRPARELLLSPDHAVFVDGVLIPVRCLLDGGAIAQRPVATVSYWHVELASHDVLLAERLGCESFLDTGQRAAFENGGVAVQLHPDFARLLWDGDACAPLVLAGPICERVRGRLRQRWAARRQAGQAGSRQ